MSNKRLANVEFTLTSTAGAFANNIDTNEITAHVMADGLHQYGVDVLFSTSVTGASFSNGSQTIAAKTNALGTCTVSLRSEVSGLVNVNGTCLVEEVHMANVNSEFLEKADVITLTESVQVDNSRADGVTANRIVYSLKQGNVPVPGQFLTFTAFSTSGGAKLSAAFGQTDSNGSYILDITNTTAETVLVTAASAISLFASVASQINFVEVDTAYTITSLITVNGTAADGVSQNKVLFQVLDGLNKPVSGKLLQFIPSTNLSLQDTFATTDSNGTVTLGCSALLASSYSITAVLYGENVLHTVGNITFVQSAELDSLTGVILKNEALDDGVDYCEIQYRLTKKSTRDVIENQKIEIQLNSITAFPSARTIITDYAGIATLRVYNTVDESVVVSAYTANESLSERTIIEFVAENKNMTFTGTASATRYHGLNEFITNYEFKAGRTYQIIAAITGSQYNCSANYVYVNGTCTYYAGGIPTVGAGFSVAHHFSGTGTFTCTRAGTTAYFRNYYYMSAGAAYSVTINDLSA